MSFALCLAQLKADGTIDAERAARFEAEFDRLNKSYRKTMGATAAIDAASRDAMDALEFDALLKRRQAALSITTQKGLLTGLQAHVDAGGNAGRWATALMEHREGIYGVAGVENVRAALSSLAWARMGDFLGTFKRDILGRIKNPDVRRDVVRSLRGEQVDSAAAKELASSIADTFEWLRLQYNAVGGNIAKLEGWGLPQSHDALGVAQAGYEEWRDFIKPLLAPERMIDNTTGKAFADGDALEDALETAWRNISSEGMDGQVPGAFNGSGKLANRRADHRFFVFKDADAWLAYNDRFGTGDPFNAVTGHIGSMTRDIAAMRVLGPNPAHTIRWMQDILGQQALPQRAGANAEATAIGKEARKGARQMERMWRYYSGDLTPIAPENRSTARFFAGVRNWNVLTKLGRAALSAIPTDPVFNAFTARFNDLPVTKVMGSYLGTFNPLDAGHRAAAEHAGLVVNEMTQRAQKIWSETRGVDMVELTRRGADGLLRTTLLSPHTVASKQALGLGFMKEWAEIRGIAFDALSEGKRRSFERYGIDAADWDRLRAVKPDDTGGVTLLRPGDLARLSDGADPAALDSAIKFFSLIDSETRFGTPGELLRAQTALALGGRGTALERGTILGEAAHSMTQFKTYSVIATMTHMERAIYGRGAMTRWQYAMALPVFLTLAGTLALNLRLIAEGKDPADMTDPATYGRGFAVGGGAGYVGDIAAQGLAGQSGTTGAVASYVTGPTIGSVVDPAINLTLGNIGEAARGEETNIPRELLRTARSNIPGGNAWYAQLAVHRGMLDQLQMSIDPDYAGSFSRARRRAVDQGTPMWWAPGEQAPERAPDFDNLTGEGAGR